MREELAMNKVKDMAELYVLADRCARAEEGRKYPSEDAGVETDSSDEDTAAPAKKGRRRKYTPFSVDDDDELPEGYVNPLSQTYGSEKDIEPVSRKNDGWDIRQW